jgi:hypothetical protein
LQAAAGRAGQQIENATAPRRGRWGNGGCPVPMARCRRRTGRWGCGSTCPCVPTPWAGAGCRGGRCRLPAAARLVPCAPAAALHGPVHQGRTRQLLLAHYVPGGQARRADRARCAAGPCSVIDWLELGVGRLGVAADAAPAGIDSGGGLGGDGDGDAYIRAQSHKCIGVGRGILQSAVAGKKQAVPSL